MTTPINSFQIVMGKLFSRLLQLFLLLAITLPLLAIIRVFGGVPWSFVVSGLCITVSAAIFAGSLSLYFSIHSRRAYVVILRTVFTLGLLYGCIPAMILAIAHSNYRVPPIDLIPYLSLANPVFYIKFHTAMMLSAGGLGAMVLFSWPVHCIIMLAASAAVLTWTVKVVRKVALRQAVGQIDNQVKPKSKKKNTKNSPKTKTARKSFGPIRPIDGSPIVWKELRAPLIQGGEGRNSLIGLIVAVIALLITYGVCIRDRCLDSDTIHVAYALIFLFFGLIINMVLSATTITSEKEARSWPILLTTPLTDWHILLGKAFGVLRRCLPIWSLLAGHVAVFVLVGYIHPILVLHLMMIVTWIIVFLCGSGLYFSTRFKRTTSAVVANIGLALMLWVVIPIILGLISVAMEDDDIINNYAVTNPVIQTVVTVQATAAPFRAKDSLAELRYRWPNDRLSFHSTTRRITVAMLTYIAAGCLFAWRAKHRFRRNIF
jgi:ABC-type transport system involved in multi-copper enzyme maturation permease subunit